LLPAALPMKQRLEHWNTAVTYLYVPLCIAWIVNDDSVSFENIMVKETRGREVKYFIESCDVSQWLTS
jgi:hypothetical protein